MEFFPDGTEKFYEELVWTFQQVNKKWTLTAFICLLWRLQYLPSRLVEVKIFHAMVSVGWFKLYLIKCPYTTWWWVLAFGYFTQWTYRDLGINYLVVHTAVLWNISQCISVNRVLERLFRGQFSLNVRTATMGELKSQLPFQHHSWSQPQLLPTALSHEGWFIIRCAYMYLTTWFQFKDKTFGFEKAVF